MTNKEQIEVRLRQITRAAQSPDLPGPLWQNAQAQVKYIRNKLDEIEHLLKEPEPETLASSVLRLTDLCNRLEAENHELKQELYVTTRSNAWLRERFTWQNELLEEAERRIKRLRATCGKVLADAGITELRTSNVSLLRQNQKLEEDLSMADAHVEELQKDLARKVACLKRVRDNLERIRM